MSTNLPPRRVSAGDEDGPESSGPLKDQYSLDEMMRALRDKEREKEEKGEVVTRADGTVARKIKRRHRRSKQPGKETPEMARKKIIVRVVLVALLVLILLLTGLFLIIHQNSKGYREGLEEMAANWTGAEEVSLGGLKRLPGSCTINAARFSWLGDSFIKDLQVNKVTGEVGFAAFFGARPGGPQLGGRSGKMTLQNPSSAWEGIALQDEDEFPFRFSQYFCEALDVRFGERGPVALKDASVILSYEGLEGYQVTIDEGILQLAGWNDFPISSALLRFREGEIDIRRISLEQTRSDGVTLGGGLDLRGKFPLKPGAQARLELETEDFPLELLVGKRLSRFIQGSLIKSEGEVGFTVGADELDEVRVDFEGKRARMDGLPFLMNLDSLFPDQGFDVLEFEEGVSKASLSGTLRVRPEGMALENLELAGRKGQLQFEGGLIIGNDDRLEGVFDVTMNRVYLTSHPKLKNSPLLAESSDGYVRFRFRVGGTLRKPTDTFLEVIGLDSAVLPGEAKEGNAEDLWDRLLDPQEGNKGSRGGKNEPELIPGNLKELEELRGE